MFKTQEITKYENRTVWVENCKDIKVYVRMFSNNGLFCELLEIDCYVNYKNVTNKVRI